MSGDGLDLERALDSISVSDRLRQDLGDLDDLIESIRRFGLLQPVTIAPDGTLLCGARRVEACRMLGLRTIRVWVRSGISTPLQRHLAEHHENTVRKPYTPTEAAHIYAELKAILQEEAARNVAATQFGGETATGAVPGVPTVGTPIGNAAKKAALAVTGTRSDLTHERVLEVERIAADPDTPEALRAQARAELEATDRDRNVAGPYARVKAAEAGLALDDALTEPGLPATLREQTEDALHRLQEAESSTELLSRARDALARARVARSRPKEAATPRQYPVRLLMTTVTETSGWWTHYDPAEVGRELTTEQWQAFDEWIARSVAFHRNARSARP